MPGDSPSWPHHRCNSWIRNHNRPGFPQLLAARTHIRNVQHAPTARTRQQLVDHASRRCARPRTSEGTTLNTCRARRWRRRHRPRQPSAPNRLNSPRPPRRRRDLHDASRCHLDGRIGTRGRRGRRRRRRLRHGQSLEGHHEPRGRTACRKVKMDTGLAAALAASAEATEEGGAGGELARGSSRRRARRE